MSVGSAADQELEVRAPRGSLGPPMVIGLRQLRPLQDEWSPNRASDDDMPRRGSEMSSTTIDGEESFKRQPGLWQRSEIDRKQRHQRTYLEAKIRIDWAV